MIALLVRSLFDLFIMQRYVTHAEMQFPVNNVGHNKMSNHELCLLT